MPEDTRGKEFDIQKEIYHTQWTNIRHHWEQTFDGIKQLTFLITLAIVPLKYIRITHEGRMIMAIDSDIAIYLKLFVGILIGLMGLVTFLNQFNHYQRSKQARKVIIRIEKEWGLYDKDDTFKFQDTNTKYSYAKFAGGEKRLTNAIVQFSYILVITVMGILFVVFA
jgi:hypothetical protein